MLVYIYRAALYCEDCGAAIREDLTKAGDAPEDPDDEGSYDSDDFPKGPTEEGESDSPSHCDGCACFLESTLTSEGEAYVIGLVKRDRAKGAPAFTPLAAMPVSEQYGGPGQYSRPSEEWAAFYDHLDFGPDPEDDDEGPQCTACGERDCPTPDECDEGNTHSSIPADFVPQPLQPGQAAKDRVTCGHCGLSWDDGVSTGRTPTPSGRCPFEYFHTYDDEGEPIACWKEGCYLAVLDDAGKCEVHGYPPE